MSQEYIFHGLRRSVLDSEPLKLALENALDLFGIDGVVVERESIDARRKPNIEYVYSLRFSVSAPSPRLRQLLAEGRIAEAQPRRWPKPEPHLTLSERPVIVGFGPAGMFAGLELAHRGYRPLILERGRPVGQRAADVRALWSDGDLDPESNMQFGEGGAGAFSDGKLTTGKRAALDEQVLETLVAAGAPESILYSHRPHIGTDYLPSVVTHIREEIETAGGEVRFRARLDDIEIEDGALRAITVANQRLPASCLVLALGHSARDTIRMLYRRGVAMEPKPFAVGTRIEHPADLIDEVQYGAQAAAVLGAADYRLTHRHSGRPVYTFCMCPGGQVVCASSEPGGQVSNGMSSYARDGRWSNAAVVVGVDPRQLGIATPMDALDWQQSLERAAYVRGGGGYVAVAQRARDYCTMWPSRTVPDTTYRPGVAAGSVAEMLPPFAREPIRAALLRWERTIPGFVDQGVLIGLESRTSSPLRMTRTEDFVSTSVAGLYLLGEGAGYAGGIMTCARDALRFAQIVKPRG